MIDIHKTRLAFRTIIVDATILSANAIAWENRKLDTKNLDLWAREDYFPVTEGASDNSGDDVINGIMQYTVYVKIGSSVKTVENMTKAIGDLFDNGEQFTDGNNATVVIDSTVRGVSGSESAWYSMPVRINFRVFN